jgi:hypothetical protein
MKRIQHINPYFFILIMIFAFSCKKAQVPTINIVKEGGIGWTIKEPCKIIYSINNDEVELKAKIKCRGGVSSRYFKHSYSLELDHKYGLGNLPENDDWILNANYIDKTFMRHKISYDLFREMNPNKNIAAKSSFVNVKLNGIYDGLYVLMEEINASLAGLDKKDSLAMLFKDPPVFRKEKLSYVQDSLNYYQQKFPKINKLDKTSYIEKFINFLFNSKDSTFVKEVSTWIDIENVIDWHIILLFSNNGDGIMKNFYLYKINKNTPFRIAIWDYDHSFGRDGDNEHNLMERELNCERSILLMRLSQIPETGYLPKLKERWYELRNQNIISFENFKAHIDRNHKIIRNEIENNFKKWPIDDNWYFDNNNYNQEIDLMLDFVKIRITQLDEYMSNLNYP